MAITKTMDGHVNIDGRLTVGNHCSAASIKVQHEGDTLCLSAMSDNGVMVKMQALISDIKEAVMVTPDGI